MLVDGEMRRRNGSWRGARVWVETGDPDLFLPEGLAGDLGMDLSAPPARVEDGRLEVPLPTGLRLGGVLLEPEGVRTWVGFEPGWLFSTVHNDAILPATVLRRYQVVLDYPRREVTIGSRGSLPHRGTSALGLVDPQTGMVQLPPIIGSDTLSFALDNGASYSFTTADLAERLSRAHPDWPTMSGALGTANIWGWWPEEEEGNWAKAALYRIVVVRLRWRQPTVEYVARRTGEGLSRKHIIRCPKRYVAREVFQLLPGVLNKEEKTLANAA